MKRKIQRLSVATVDSGKNTDYSIAQIPLVESRHDTSPYLAHVFWHRKKL